MGGGRGGGNSRFRDLGSFHDDILINEMVRVGEEDIIKAVLAAGLRYRWRDERVGVERDGKTLRLRVVRTEQERARDCDNEGGQMVISKQQQWQPLGQSNYTELLEI